MMENEMVKRICEHTEITGPRKEVKEIIKIFLQEIREELKKGEKVSLKDLGTLSPKETKARKGRNPRTGEEIEIPARKTVVFKASPNFIKNFLN